MAKNVNKAFQAYFGAVDYVGAVKSKSEDARTLNDTHVKNGLTGGFTVVSGAASVSAKVGGMAGAAGAVAVSIPMQVGNIILPSYIKLANKTNRIWPCFTNIEMI